MEVQLSRWGNSLGIRIPKDIAGRVGFTEGTRVDMTAVDGRIVIAPTRPRYRLTDLLVNMTPQAVRGAFNWGDDVGHERVEE